MPDCACAHSGGAGDCPDALPVATGECHRGALIRTVRQECLDHLLILSERHLERVLRAYVAFYNGRRPHQGLDQQCPVPVVAPVGGGPIVRRAVLGGLIHDYERQAAGDGVVARYTALVSGAATSALLTHKPDRR